MFIKRQDRVISEPSEEFLESLLSNPKELRTEAIQSSQTVLCWQGLKISQIEMTKFECKNKMKLN